MICKNPTLDPVASQSEVLVDPAVTAYSVYTDYKKEGRYYAFGTSTNV